MLLRSAGGAAAELRLRELGLLGARVEAEGLSDVEQFLGALHGGVLLLLVEAAQRGAAGEALLRRLVEVLQRPARVARRLRVLRRLVEVLVARARCLLLRWLLLRCLLRCLLLLRWLLL